MQFCAAYNNFHSVKEQFFQFNLIVIFNASLFFFPSRGFLIRPTLYLEAIMPWVSNGDWRVDEAKLAQSRSKETKDSNRYKSLLR
jgi:hypothetical protein